MPSAVSPWLLAARPKTLPAAIVPVWVGSLPAMFGSTPGVDFSPLLFAATLASCLCIQIATNLFNDAIDSHKGADTDRRLGPVRATASGLLPARAVMLGALGFCLLAALIAIPLIQARGWPIIAIGSVSLLLAFAYTGGPFPLAYRGMGELFVIAFFGFVAVLGSWFVQSGRGPALEHWIMGLQTGLYSSVLIAINNLRDIDEDRQSNKRTLAVRWGKTFARAEIAAFCLIPVGLSLWQHWFLPAATLPVGLIIAAKVAKTEPGRVYNRYLALGALQLILFAALLTVAWAFKS
jgi:1,4-dihydroxy-2-naphthoate octaprenyltransferase